MAVRRSRLARRRESEGFTQESLAAALKVDPTTVQRWERGDTKPQPWMRPRLGKLLRTTPQELDVLLRAGDEDRLPEEGVGKAEWDTGFGSRTLAEVDDMLRRELLRLLSMAGAMLALPAPDVSSATAVAEAEFEGTTADLWRVYGSTTSKADLLPLVRSALSDLTTDLTRPPGPHGRRHLWAALGDLYQLAGEIYFDANAYTDAAYCYSLAAEASKEAREYDQWACALTRHAFLSVYERRFDQAAPMLETAAALAARGDSSLSTRHWVAVVQAETFAGLGDLDACQRALDTAEGVRDLTGQIHNGGWLRFDGSRLAEERGTCYVTLGRPDLAEAALTDALRQKLSPRRRASVLTDLAVIGAQRRDPDQVVAHAETVLEQARQTGSWVIGRKLHGLQRHLVPLLTDHKIQDLNGKITALVGKPLAV